MITAQVLGPHTPGGDEPIETTPTTPITPGDGTVVYLKNDANWSNPTCYMWSDSTDSNATWPGAKMTNIGDGFWIYQASKEYKNCIFNDGGASQTGDLTAQNGYYCNGSRELRKVFMTLKPNPG